MGRIINSAVGEVSPNLYKAALGANLNPQEQVVYEQLMLTVKKAKKLRGMSPEKAKQEFRSLKPQAQDALRALYPTAKFAEEDPSNFDRAFGAFKKVGGFFLTPIVETFKAAGVYGKLINMPYSGIQQIRQGADPFSRKTWENAHDGKNLFNEETIAKLEQKYSAAEVKLAKGLLEGKTPGEIIEEYGKPDENILNAVVTSLNDPDKFRPIIGDVKYAQFSPGRDLLKGATIAYDTKIPNSGGLLTRFILGDLNNPETRKEWVRAARFTSGMVDFFYQIVLDPLTWFTGGSTKVFTKGEKLAENLLTMANKGDVAGGVRTVFADKDVIKLWDEQAGPMIQKMADARATKDTATFAVLRRDFGKQFPGLNRDEAIDFYIDNKVFDAKSAEARFTDVTNIHYLLSGRVDGVSYTRNGIATARNQRHLSSGIATFAYNIFNPTSAITVGKTTRSIQELEKKGGDIVQILSKSGDEIDQGVNPLITQLKDIDGDIRKAHRIARAVGKLMARSPSGGGIRYGEDAIKTIDNFRLVARQVLPRDLADFVTIHFLDSSADEQVVIVRNLYAAIMDRYGLTGTVRGKELRNQILSKTFNNRSGMTLIADTQVPKDFASEVSSYVIRTENDVPIIQSRGIVHPYQVAEQIAPLPYEQIIETVATYNKGKNIPALFDGATRNKYITNFVDFWTILTLFPRLGIRSAIDETFMYILNAPSSDLRNFALGQGRKLGKVATAFTASKAAVGPIKRGVNKLFLKGGAEEAIPIAARQQIAADIASSKKIPIEEVTHMMIREETAKRAIDTFGKSKAINFEYLRQVLVHHPDVLNSMAQSLSARTSLSGAFDQQILDAIFTPSMLTQALNDAGLKTGRKFRAISTRELRAANEKWLTLAHYDAWYLQFVNNKRSVPSTTGTANRVLDPGAVFFANDGLRTASNFATARTDLLRSVGVEWDFVTKQYVVKDPVSVKEFLSLFGDSVYFRQSKLPDAEIARIHAETMLLDMRNTFHGGPSAFNQTLLDAVRSKYNDLVKYEKTSGKKVNSKWSKASSSLTFQDFEKATDGYKPMGDINTRIEFDGFVPSEDLPSMWEKFGNAIMEQMDRQVTGLYRQPAVMIAYSRLREGYAGLEREFAQKVFKEKMAAKPYANANPAIMDKFMDEAEQIAQKRYAEIAMNEAVDSVLKFADNPAIRSNLAMNTRTIARFYRATEDFWRRYYRLMREKPLQVIYRMRLAHQGLNARGEVYEDEKGEPYVVLPTDTIINSAVEPIVRTITGGSFKVPQFNDITLKLRLINPSFAPDAGQPSLSGPVAAISMLGFKALLGYLPGQLKPGAIKTGEAIDNFALGNIGENLTLQKAVVPLFLQNIWALLPKDEKDRQETTAAFQAISYMQAFGYKMPDPNDAVQVDKFLRDVRIASHNVIAIRAILGMISPVSPTLREGKGVPEYYKAVGIPTLRGTFYDILEGIAKTESEDVFDPYELAIATFIGKNPGKLVYTVSRNDRNTAVILQKTKEVQDWSIKNKQFISQYGDAALIFAPQTGEFNSSVYAWLESQDLVSQPDLESYLKRVQVSQAKQAYFQIERETNEALAREVSVVKRRQIIDQAARDRALLKASNPLLKDSLETGGWEVSSEEDLLSKMEQALLNKKTPISNATREKMALATKLMREYIVFATNEQNRTMWNFVDAKREKKLAIEQFLNDLISMDPAVREANRAVFQPILDFYSRDTQVAFRR